MMKVVIWKSPKYLRGILCRLFHIALREAEAFASAFFIFAAGQTYRDTGAAVKRKEAASNGTESNKHLLL